MKIRQLEMKLQEEEHQRKLVQVQAHQVTTAVFLFNYPSIHSLSTLVLCLMFLSIVLPNCMLMLYVNDETSTELCLTSCTCVCVCMYACVPQLQTGLEANRILLQSVSPRLSGRQSKERKSSSKVKTFTGVI